MCSGLDPVHVCSHLFSARAESGETVGDIIEEVMESNHKVGLFQPARQNPQAQFGLAGHAWRQSSPIRDG